MTIESEFASLVPAAKMNRRDFVSASVGVGFAAAVMPIMAQQVIKTDTAGLVAGAITVRGAADTIPAYRAKPESGKAHPIVLVVSEIFGVHEYIADVCRRLAKLGYYAIAPELFIRQGDVRQYANVMDIIKEVVAKVPDAQAFADLDACAGHAGNDGGDLSRLAVTGFCWGGRMTWLYSAHNPNIKCGVAWYGRLVNAFDPTIQPKNPIDVINQLHGPVLGLYGAKDDGIPLASVESMTKALATGSNAAKASVFQVYADAPHGFHADYRPSYRKEAAQDGWKRMQAWFTKHGV